MREKIGDYIIDPSFEPRTGNFGSTFKATHPYFKGKTFAVKVISNLDGRREADFMAEIEALLALQFQSEHIVVFSYAGKTNDGDLYCVMEYCEGGDLNELCERHGGLDEKYVALIGAQVCRALSEAHTQGIIHRDIKPANMMLGRLRSGEFGVKLIDFGLAKTLDATMQSQPGVKGTPLFSSPEQIRDENLDDRSDVYSLGVALWYLLLGGKPAQLNHAKRSEVEKEHVNLESRFQVDCKDRELAAILERMMEKQRDNRYSSAGEVQRALDSYLNRVTDFSVGDLSCSDLVPELVDRSDRVRSGGGDSGSTIIEKVESSQLSESLEDAFEIIQRCPIETSWGQFYMAAKADGSSSLIAILDQDLFENSQQDYNNEFANLIARHSSLIHSSKGYPDAYLRPIGHYWFSGGESVVEFEFCEGILLQDVVRRHGKFRFSHSIGLLKTLAGLLDFSEESGVPLPTIGEAEILLVPRERGSDRAFLNQPMREWPDHKVEVNPLSLPENVVVHFEEGDSEMTLDSNDLITTQGHGDGSPNFTAAIIFSARVYRLIGGKPVPAVAYQSKYGYSNISGLTEESNNLLRDCLSGAVEESTRCCEILKAICDAEGEVYPWEETPLSKGHHRPSHIAEPKAQKDPPLRDREFPSRQLGGETHTGSSSRTVQDQSHLISVSSGPRYQAANLPEAVSTGPSEFRNPFTKKRFPLEGHEIRPYRQLVCEETGEIFQLPAQIEAMECLVNAQEPGIVFSPYVSPDEDNRVNFVEVEGVELWREGERGRCPFTGLPYKLPQKLPLLRAVTYDGEPGKVSSPYYLGEEDLQAIGPTDWIGDAVLSLHDRPFQLPSEDELPKPKPISKVDEYGGTATSPFDGSQFEISDDDWVAGKVVVCSETNLLCRLPNDLPERKLIAEIYGDGSEGIVINPFTDRNQKIPGKLWERDQVIENPDGSRFFLPPVLPDLMVEEYLLDKPGWVVNPYSGEKISLLPEEWELGIRVQRGDRSFRILQKLPDLREAVVTERVFSSVISPYDNEGVEVLEGAWRPEAILKCPRTECLFRLPQDLPEPPDTIEIVPQQFGIAGEVESPYVKGKRIEVSGKDWVGGGLVLCEESERYFCLPYELPPLVAREVDGALRLVESPYDPGQQQEVPVEKWYLGEEIQCQITGRVFLLPDTHDLLSRLEVLVADGPGLVVVPQTGEKSEVDHDKWVGGEILAALGKAKGSLEVVLPEEVPEIPTVELIAEDVFGRVKSPFEDGEISLSNEGDWEPGRILRCPKSRFLYRLPEKLPPWIREADVDLDKTGEVGFVFSPYLDREQSLKVTGEEWEEGRLILCEKSQRQFRLPELPPLRAEILDGGNGLVACPYTSGDNREQKIPSSQWKAGKQIASKKAKGRDFVLPDDLPPLLAKGIPERPGYLKSPYGRTKVEFRVERENWKPNHEIECPKSGNTILTPSEEDLPEVKVAELVEDEDRKDQFVSGSILSPYGKTAEQSVRMEDWRSGELIRCDETDLIMRLPTSEEGLPTWAEDITLDLDHAGWVVDPKTGASVEIPGHLWERGAVVPLSGEEERFVRLSRDIPPLVAEATGPGLIKSPYEEGGKAWEVEPTDWVSCKEISCPATGRPLTLPEKLPHLVAILDEKIVGRVYSPFDPENPIEIAVENWAKGKVVPDPSGDFQLPDNLPEPAEICEVDLESAKVVSPYDSKSIFKPESWKPGLVLTCPGTGGLIKLPGDLENPFGGLTIDPREVLDASVGEVKDPFVGKLVEVPGRDWNPGTEITSETGNVFVLPDSLPPLRAELVKDRLGYLVSPYSDVKPFRVESISDWVPGAPVKCPRSSKTMFLPKEIPFEQAEVLAAWENEEKKRRRLVTQLGVVGTFLVIAVLVFLFWPDRDSSWEEQKEVIAGSGGLQRLELAVQALNEFPEKREEISELALPALGNFNEMLDQIVLDMSELDVTRMNSNLSRLAYGDSKSAAEKAELYVTTAKDLKIRIETGVSSFSKEDIAKAREELSESMRSDFPVLAGKVIDQLAVRDRALAAAMAEANAKKAEDERSSGGGIASKGKAKEASGDIPELEEDYKGPKIAENSRSDDPKPDSSNSNSEKPEAELPKVPKFASGENLTLESGSRFIWIGPGTFEMGSSKVDIEEIYGNLAKSTKAGIPDNPELIEPRQTVTLTQGFWLGETEVTIGEFLEFLNDPKYRDREWKDFSPSYTPVEKAGTQWKMKGESDQQVDGFVSQHTEKGVTWGDRRQPMAEISWDTAMEYCRYLNDKHRERLPEGYVFTLPTEAEWEYCARAGSSEALPTGKISFKGKNNSPEVGELAWYAGNSKTDYPAYDVEFTEEKEFQFSYAGTQVVGGKSPNAWGFKDMLGNVSEWCYDFIVKEENRWPPVDRTEDEGAESDEEGGDHGEGEVVHVSDPTGPPIGDKRNSKVHRGGGFWDQPYNCRPSVRNSQPKDNSQPWLGFRIALSRERN